MSDEQWLTLDEEDRLRRILIRVPVFAEGQNCRLFLLTVPLTHEQLANYKWDGAASIIVAQLLEMARNTGTPISGGRPGRTLLGAVLDRLLADEKVGEPDSEFLRDLIARYGQSRPGGTAGAARYPLRIPHHRAEPFVGREDVLARVEAVLDVGTTTPALCGPGGIG